MKKLILGLVLFFGMSGMALASADVKLESLNIFKQGADCYTAIVDIEERDAVILDCFHGYHAVSIDCQGIKTNIYLGGHASSCGSDEQDGTIFFHMTGTINACQAGPLREFTEALEIITDLF